MTYFIKGYGSKGEIRMDETAGSLKQAEQLTRNIDAALLKCGLEVMSAWAIENEYAADLRQIYPRGQWDLLAKRRKRAEDELEDHETEWAEAKL